MLDHAVQGLDGPLPALVSRCVGYRFEGLSPGFHRGLPGPALTIVISLGAPLTLRAPGSNEIDSYQMLVGGMHTEPATIFHDGSQYGVQLDLTPRGARCLFGMPASELAGHVVPLDDVLPEADELLDRMALAANWTDRFQVLDDTLSRRAVVHEPTVTDLAWSRIITSAGAARVESIAADAGWSRRHLRDLFRREYGLSPKDVARITRFNRANRLLQTETLSFAEVAAVCGYVDQSHMTRDWHDFAGCSPSQWMATEELPFVQDDDALLAAR